MTCMKQEFCIHEKYCQRHIGQNFDSCILFSRNSKPMTNEEWLHTLNTEQKAEWLSKIKQPFPCSTFLKCDKSCGLSTQCRGDDVEPTDKERWVEWLKQPHGGES